jgi:hypothetical protein
MTTTKKYEEVGRKIGALVDEKQKAYGDSFGKAGAVLRILYPDGIGLEKYDDMLTIVRIIDKLFRVATEKDALDENPFQDIAGYCILECGRNAKGKSNASNATV